MVWLFAALLIAGTIVVYEPAWRGAFLWDDDANVTRSELRSPEGLGRIWTDVGATQQYYPLLHSAFWVQWQLWGDSTLGYHLVNIVLHGAVAALVVMILRQLAVPGAFLAGAIFAMHPVCVESVAWITELKNTLSAVFCMGSILAYLRFDRTRGRWPYVLALGLFVLGLLSKTAISPLPAALAVIFWWKRGHLSWKRDILPLAPLFVAGVAAGLGTAWIEKSLVGADGEQFGFSVIERCLLAGRVVWFYAGKIFWPADLTFIYPRWDVDAGVWWQYLYPAGVLAVLAGLWRLRRWSRAPLAGVLFFLAMLFPAMGFFNVYAFQYSFVADHFQYLSCLGLIALAAGGLAWALGRLGNPRGLYAMAASGLLLAGILGALTCRQSAMYVNNETLYRQTLKRNPECWMAHNNWGNVLLGLGRFEEAASHYEQAMRFKPDSPKMHNNMGTALSNMGRYNEAISHYQQAARLKPDFALAQYNWGATLIRMERYQEGAEHLRIALRLKPGMPAATKNLRRVEALLQQRPLTPGP